VAVSSPPSGQKRRDPAAQQVIEAEFANSGVKGARHADSGPAPAKLCETAIVFAVLTKVLGTPADQLR
jgi:hypothetical protein